MYTIKRECHNEIMIKNSRFITILKKVTNQDEVFKALADAQIRYPGATHYCYGYILENQEKASDDHEPGGTAGLPILEVMKKQQLKNVLCIVVRYFGGIKLGAGGLVRAYTKSVSEALKTVDLNELVEGFQIQFKIDYKTYKKLEPYLKEGVVENATFLDQVEMIVDASPTLLRYLDDWSINYEKGPSVLIEKEF